MEHYKETSETWNKIASLYEERFMDLDLYDKTYDHFCDLIENKNADVLDIGCGPGNISRYVLSKRPGFHINGIDIAPNMIELARKNIPNATFQILDSRNIKKLNKKYDGIICGFCLPYLSEPDGNKCIADCADMLTDQGVFYLSFMEGEPEQSGFQTASNGERVYFYYYRLDDITQRLKNHGFTDPEISRIDYTRANGVAEVHTVVVAKKDQRKRK